MRLGTHQHSPATANPPARCTVPWPAAMPSAHPSWAVSAIGPSTSTRWRAVMSVEAGSCLKQQECASTRLQACDRCDSLPRLPPPPKPPPACPHLPPVARPRGRCAIVSGPRDGITHADAAAQLTGAIQPNHPAIASKGANMRRFQLAGMWILTYSPGELTTAPYPYTPR